MAADASTPLGHSATDYLLVDIAGRRAAVSFQFGLLSAPSSPQAVHRRRRPIAGTSISSDKIDTSTLAEWWQSMR